MYFSFREGCDVTVIISLNERFLKYKPPQRLHQCTTAEPLRVNGRALIFKMTTRGTLVYVGWAKKRGHRLMTIILSNLNRFTDL